MNKKLTVLILFIFSSIFCVAQPAVIDVKNNPFENIGLKIGFKEDVHKNSSVNAIMSLPDTAFKLGTQEIFNGGTSGKVWWMKLKFKNATNIIPYLVFEYGNIDYLDIYYKNNNNQITHLNSGTFAKNETRALISTEYIFQIHNAGGDIKEVYIRAKAVNTLLAPIKLVDGITLAKAIGNKYTLQILFIGIAFSLFLFNLYMYVTSRDKRYGLYMIRIIFLFYIYVLAYLNSYAHFLPLSISRFILVHAQGFAAIGFIATIQFNNTFLTLKRNMPRFSKWFNLLVILWLGVLILSLWDNRHFTNRLTQILVFITSASLIYTSVMALRAKKGYKKDKYMIFYLTGWLPICLASVYIVFTLLNILPLRDYSFQVLLAAGVLEAILITLALLGDKISILTKGKKRAEQKSIALIRERNLYLEQKIEERTKELQLTNDKLQNSLVFKDKIFSIIAHDMRSPLSTLRLVLQMADRDMLNPEDLSQFLAKIRKNTEQVQQMMDNLLNWSISQMKLQVYEPKKIDISQFLAEQIGLYEPLAQAKQISITIQFKEHFFALADQNQLALIIRNLVDNAIKFTPINGFIELGLKNEASKNLFYILNSGELISDSTISRILSDDDNILVSSYGTSQEKGTGLGLQLCKEFIKNLNSKLEIRHTITQQIPCTMFCFQIHELSD